MGKPNVMRGRPVERQQLDGRAWPEYPVRIHREHLDPLAASRGFLYGFFAGILWLALVLYLIL